MISKQGAERLRGAQFREPGEIDAAAGIGIAEVAMRILGRERGCIGLRSELGGGDVAAQPCDRDESPVVARALTDAFDNDFHALGEHGENSRMNVRCGAELGFGRDSHGPQRTGPESANGEDHRRYRTPH